MYCCLFELRGYKAYQCEYLYEKTIKILQGILNAADRFARINRTQIMLVLPFISAEEVRKYTLDLQTHVETALGEEIRCYCCAAEVRNSAILDAVQISKQLLQNTNRHNRLTVLHYYHFKDF